MKESTTKVTAVVTHTRFSPCSSLAAIGLLLHKKNLFGPIKEAVKIAQKTVKHTPIQKLYDAFVSILAGAHGLVEINTRLRCDVALQRAFGRSACAEQSVVQQTLDACTEENVQQMQSACTAIYRLHGDLSPARRSIACTAIYRLHSLGYSHDYERRLQLLDVGCPLGDDRNTLR